MQLEFHELKYHGKLDFHKIEFKKKSDRLLSISQTVVDPYIFFLNSGIRPFWPSIGATVMFSKK